MTRSSSRHAESARQPGAGRLPAGEHRHHIGWEIRQQLLPDPVVQSRKPFVGVQQNNGPPGPVPTVGEWLMQCGVDSPAHPVRRGQEIARVDPDEPALLPAGGHGEGVEQRRLSDSPRPVHEEHCERG